MLALEKLSVSFNDPPKKLGEIIHLTSFTSWVFSFKINRFRIKRKKRAKRF